MGNAGRVDEFWNREASRYNEAEGRIARAAEHRHLFGARILERELHGRVLCAGGLWVGAEPRGLTQCEITVLDVSASMLEHFESQGVTGKLGDARKMPFPDGCFDHVVFPLVIHHITDDSARLARKNARHVIEEARRVLEPDGRIWIREIVLPAPAYWAELAAAPVIRAALHLRQIPLVILHGEGFLKRALEEAGFSDITITKVSDPRRWGHRTNPIIGLPKLAIPEVLLPPMHHILMSGRVR